MGLLTPTGCGARPPARADARCTVSTTCAAIKMRSLTASQPCAQKHMHRSRNQVLWFSGAAAER